MERASGVRPEVPRRRSPLLRAKRPTTDVRLTQQQRRLFEELLEPCKARATVDAVGR
jgi:hypothetical protein